MDTQDDAVVVVAEDEPLIRLIIVDSLVEEGFKVCEPQHAAEAVTHIESHGQRVRILFTDVHMPGEMDGLALAHHTRRNWPWVGIIVTSGDASPLPHELPFGSRFVAKPYNVAHVIAHVRDLIGI
jgi:CheY-like chemotaxis protein